MKCLPGLTAVLLGSVIGCTTEIGGPIDPGVGGFCSAGEPGGAIALGESVSGTLSDTDCVLTDGSFADVYHFPVIADQVVRITLTSSAFDTYVLVLGPNGVPITSNDNSGGGSDSQLAQGLTRGTYSIVAGAANRGDTGAYTLSAASDEMPALSGELAGEQ